MAVSCSRRMLFGLLQRTTSCQRFTTFSSSKITRFTRLHRFYSQKSCSGAEDEVTKSYKPLKGIKVLDLSRILAGPYCTMILGDLGAEVFKVEKPGSGDDTRQWGPPWLSHESGQRSSAYFVSINRNKKSVAVDLKTKEGAEIVKKLAAKCDVLIENYIPGKLSEMGLGYSDLKLSAPHLVYVSITGFGQTGPYRQRGGYDNIAAAIGGLMHITGPRDGDPCRVGVAMTDLSTGLYALSAIMSALLYKQQTGRGQHIDCNLLNTQVATLTHIASNYLNCGVEASRWGSGHISIVPYQTFKTKDGNMMIGAGNEKLFLELCQMLDMEFLGKDERFSTNENRVRHRTELINLLSEKFLTKTTTEWCALFEDSSLPYGPVNNMQEVFKNPQVLNNEMIQSMSYADVGEIKVPAPAVSYGEGKLTLESSPPLLGEHTSHVLQEYLGYSTNELQDLKQRSVIQ